MTTTTTNDLLNLGETARAFVAEERLGNNFSLIGCEERRDEVAGLFLVLWCRTTTTNAEFAASRRGWRVDRAFDGSYRFSRKLENADGSKPEKTAPAFMV